MACGGCKRKRRQRGSGCLRARGPCKKQWYTTGRKGVCRPCIKIGGVWSKHRKRTKKPAAPYVKVDGKWVTKKKAASIARRKLREARRAWDNL